MNYFSRELEYLGTQVFVCAELLNEVTLDRVFSEAERIEQSYSRFLKNSELSVLNKNLDQWNTVTNEFFELLEFAQNMKTKTNSVLDITVESILNSWGYDRDYSLIVSGKGATGAMYLNKEKCLVKITSPIDFGSFGKGYFLDQVRRIFEKENCKNYFINAGGDLFAKGLSEKKTSWKIYFEDPRNREKVIGEVVLDNFFACSSSASRRSWKDFHHLVDAQEKRPAYKLKAIYVQSPLSGIFCDAMSTALFIMGFEEAKDFIEREKSIEALLVSPEGELWKSKNFRGSLFTC